MGSEDDEARRRREEGCRREEAIRGLLKRHDDKRLTIAPSKKSRRNWVSADQRCID
jgi:hypothetical protein